jgi:hypothetical protein
MTNRFLISVAAAALIAGTTGFANAQGAGGMNKEGTGSSVQHSAPAPGGAAQSAPQRGDAASEKAGASESKSMGSGKQAEDSVKGAQKPPQSTASDSDRAKGVKETGKDMKVEGRDSKSGTVGQAPAEKGTQGGQDRMNAQSKDQPGQKGSTTDTKPDTNRAQQNQTAPDTNRAQTSPQGGTPSTTGAVTSARVAAPPAEKQTQIVSAIKSERIQETTNVNVNVSIGTVLPASVRFHPLPPRIVEIYPEWRGFEVILIHGRYVIVRPQTREIVYIIEG